MEFTVTLLFSVIILAAFCAMLGYATAKSIKRFIDEDRAASAPTEETEDIIED